ncbi:MAG: LssY C-terminal domain-containing protein [Nocardioidaceae bacterium]
MSAREERRFSVLDMIDAAFFAFSALAIVWLALQLFSYGVKPGWPMLLLVVFWLVVSYLALPRLHRVLTAIYVPGYFIGRTRTSDGLLGDPVNLALRGNEAQVHRALTQSGWIRADDLTFAASVKITVNTVKRASYPTAPVSPLHLFDRQQDFAYQREVDNSPAKRHHVRFWRCPEGWLLPGGIAVDWLAAGTFDRSVGLSLFTLQVTHKIEEDTDVERDFLIQTITEADPAVDVEVIEGYSSGYHSRNGGGDRILTDGNLPIIDVRALDVPESVVTQPTDSRDLRPASIVFGSIVAALRGIFTLILAVGALASPADVLGGQDLTAAQVDAVKFTYAAVFLVVGALDLLLAWKAMSGRNWARLLLMAVGAVSVALIAVQTYGSRVQASQLPVTALTIFVLLALSSHRAREWSTRRSAHDEDLGARIVSKMG